MSILSRPKPKGAGIAREFLLAALFSAARPVLVLPHRHVSRLGEHVLIAWNQRPEAALAVAAAVPLLQKAREVSIVSCGAENRPGPKATHLCDYLAHFGIRARRLRTRERIFGGVTETMLFHSQLPVLMYNR